jgi:hypothetical protein
LGVPPPTSRGDTDSPKLAMQVGRTKGITRRCVATAVASAGRSNQSALVAFASGRGRVSVSHERSTPIRRRHDGEPHRR